MQVVLRCLPGMLIALQQAGVGQLIGGRGAFQPGRQRGLEPLQVNRFKHRLRRHSGVAMNQRTLHQVLKRLR